MTGAMRVMNATAKQGRGFDDLTWISLVEAPAIAGTIRIDHDGFLQLPFAGRVRAGGINCAVDCPCGQLFAERLDRCAF